MRQTVRLEGAPVSARRARQVVRDVIAGQPLGPRVADIALLLTSELIVNATAQGEGEIILDVTLEGSVLRVAVTGAAAGEPSTSQSASERDSGLALVDDLATRWGTEPAGKSGRTVWFELSYVMPVG